MVTNKTKIVLSAKEQEMVCNTEWILTKHQIVQKVVALFGAVLANLQIITEQHKSNLPRAIFVQSPKISKGENYKGLPYIMLDYPRHFNKEDVLAVRSLFWWGNFFSISIQLSGKFKTAAVLHFTTNFLMLQQQEFWICVNDNPWEHHFEADNYVSLKSLTAVEFGTLISQQSFIKMSKKITLPQWNEVPVFLEQAFLQMILLLKTSYLNGEIDL